MLMGHSFEQVTVRRPRCPLINGVPRRVSFEFPVRASYASVILLSY